MAKVAKEMVIACATSMLRSSLGFSVDVTTPVPAMWNNRRFHGKKSTSQVIDVLEIPQYYSTWRFLVLADVSSLLVPLGRVFAVPAVT